MFSEVLACTLVDGKKKKLKTEHTFQKFVIFCVLRRYKSCKMSMVGRRRVMGTFMPWILTLLMLTLFSFVKERFSPISNICLLRGT